MNKRHTPFVSLGKHLKYVREQSQQSLAEVSGAVEIEQQALERIEAGEERPAEDVLLLLISYLGVQDQEAVRMWELAKYGNDIPDQLKPDAEIRSGDKPVVMLLAMDMRTIYSDGLDIAANQAGLTLTFTQASSQSAATPVSRIGMSYEQAEQVAKALQHTLLYAKYAKNNKLLPPRQPET